MSDQYPFFTNKIVALLIHAMWCSVSPWDSVSKKAIARGGPYILHLQNLYKVSLPQMFCHGNRNQIQLRVERFRKRRWHCITQAAHNSGLSEVVLRKAEIKRREWQNKQESSLLPKEQSSHNWNGSGETSLAFWYTHFSWTNTCYFQFTHCEKTPCIPQKPV